MVGPDLRVSGHDRDFAVGDIALIDGQPLPQLARPALQMGRHAAAQVRGLIADQRTEPFSYCDQGIMATIGRRPRWCCRTGCANAARSPGWPGSRCTW